MHQSDQPVAPAVSAPPVGRLNLNRAEVVDRNFLELVQSWPDRQTKTREYLAQPIHPSASLSCREAVELFESQIIARHQDFEARAMRARGEGFYTIGSTGHEGNAVVGRLTRPTDMAFLHYRSGAFLAERSRQVPGVDFIRDTMLSFAASREEPISGGRHKVWGSVAMSVPPQTSTIASHLPKAVGAALALGRVRRLGVPTQVPVDSLVVCSFGDASTGHAVAQTAFNAAAQAVHRRLPVPILFLCEDNGIGISVETPTGWIEASFAHRYGLHYVRAHGLNLPDAYEATREAVLFCRVHRRPVFLHMEVVRLLGHAGTDPETEYHSWAQILSAEARDPLLASARLLLSEGVLSPETILSLYERTRARVREAARYAASTPKLSSVDEITGPLAPYHPERVDEEARRTPPHDQRVRHFGGVDRLPESGPPRHMAALINFGLHDLLLKYPQAILFGEDVAQRGGVYNVTKDLAARFGAGRVFNTLLDETTILGLAIGAGHVGLLPIPEIQYLAYYHNAEDQIRGEACSMQFFSNDQYRNPMVVRIAGWGYQKGFGGHFHNDNSISALRDVPGLIIATPSRGDDAVRMMRTCLSLARTDGRVVVFIEPIALYMTRDLHEPKDQQWSFKYPAPFETIPLGEGAVYHPEARDLTMFSFANGIPMSLRAARTLQEERGIRVRVVDLRWLNPLNEPFIIEQARLTGRVLVVDEGRRTGGTAEAILSLIHEQCGGFVQARRINARDTYLPLGPAADLVLPRESEIVGAVADLLDGSTTSKRVTRKGVTSRRRPLAS